MLKMGGLPYSSTLQGMAGDASLEGALTMRLIFLNRFGE
jgi:hypothetical protein